MRAPASESCLGFWSLGTSNPNARLPCLLGYILKLLWTDQLRMTGCHHGGSQRLFCQIKIGPKLYVHVLMNILQMPPIWSASQAIRRQPAS